MTSHSSLHYYLCIPQHSSFSALLDLVLNGTQTINSTLAPALLYPSAWLSRNAVHCGQKVTRLSDFENTIDRDYIQTLIDRDLLDVSKAFDSVSLP